MQLASLVHQYLKAFKAQYAAQLLPSHLRAIGAIRRCRTPDSGQMLLHCSECKGQFRHPLSCGHRSCPQCQSHEASQWLDRQQAKLLPVEYFMVTFTLPCELRALAWRHQTTLYQLLFATAASTLKDFGLNPRQLGAQIGMTAILHTHSRRLDYHPHLHVVIPGGGVSTTARQWKKTRGKFLFKHTALAKVFRARLLAAMKAAGLTIADHLPDQWVVDCKHVGKGKPALKYLPRYLYRGVIREQDIVANHRCRSWTLSGLPGHWGRTPKTTNPPLTQHRRPASLYDQNQRVLLALQRAKGMLACKKVADQTPALVTSVAKKIFAYTKTGLVQQQDRSWLASLSRSILIR